MVTWLDLYNRKSYTLEPNIRIGETYTLSYDTENKVVGFKGSFTWDGQPFIFETLYGDLRNIKIERGTVLHPVYSVAWEDLPEAVKVAYYYEVYNNILREIKAPLSALYGESRNLLRNKKIEWVRHTTWMSGTWEEVYNKWK